MNVNQMTIFQLLRETLFAYTKDVSYVKNSVFDTSAPLPLNLCNVIKIRKFVYLEQIL